jgi:hypothetical protein
MNNFSIEYYEGEEEGRSVLTGNLTDSNFKSINEAADYVGCLKVPLSVVRITEWDIENNDSCDIPEIIGSCNLDEAFELEYTSLDF